MERGGIAVRRDRVVVIVLLGTLVAGCVSANRPVASAPAREFVTLERPKPLPYVTIMGRAPRP